MKHFRPHPLVAIVALSLSSLALGQERTEERWFPDRPQQPSKPSQERVMMPDIQPLTAQHCTGDVRSFETPGQVRMGQSAKRMESSSDIAGSADVSESARASAPVASIAPAAPAPSFAPPAMGAVAKSMPAPASIAPRQRPQNDAPLRAGMVDDNVDFAGFLSFLGKKNGILDEYRARDISERHGIDVVDSSGKPIHGAVVYMDVGGGKPRYGVNGQLVPTNMDWKPIAVTDVNGKAWVFPKAVSNGNGPYRFTVGYADASRNVQIDGQRKARTQVSLDTPASRDTPRLDLSIVIDTTGSMSDEIRKLQRTLTQVVGEVERQGVDVCVNVTAYRDVYDNYVLKGIDFTSNLGAVQDFVNGLSANGGGDEPEALNQALDHVVNKLSWRKQDNVVRSVMLITDAPPKMDTAPVFYDNSMLAAGARGVRVHSVGTSGLNTDGGELVLRQVAQYTGGKFVFLTYKDAANPSRGAGDATVHDVQNYSVNTLDDLLLRLIKDDLGVKPARK